MRQMLTTNEEFRKKMEDIGRKVQEYDIKFEIVFEAIEKLISPPAKEIRITFDSYQNSTF